MSNKKRDSKLFGNMPVVTVEAAAASGSKQQRQRTPNVDVAVGEKKEAETLTIPIEQYPSFMTKTEILAYREYMIQQFPEQDPLDFLQTLSTRNYPKRIKRSKKSC
jgi:hypothetical protein